MIRGSLFVQHRFFIFLLLSLIAVMGLFGCVEGGTSMGGVCTPESPNVNVYKVGTQQWANTIFQNAISAPVVISTPVAISTLPASAGLDLLMAGMSPAVPSNDQAMIARFFALQCLANETERWSDTQVINLNNSRDVQITVTFISPELLQAVFLGEVLRNKNKPLVSDFETQMQTMLNSVASRDELLFLLTITVINKNSTDLSPYILDIPIKEMVLTNGAWLKVNPNHADQILDQPINLSEGPVFGYLAYPLAVLDNTNNNCNWVLEPKYNTSLVITMPSYVLNNISVAVPYSWTIPYSPLMHVENNEDSSTYCAPASFDEKQLLPLDVPPISKNEPDYWQGFARFVWSQVTHGNY